MQNIIITLRKYYKYWIMKLIKPSVEYIPQNNSVDGIYRHIEKCGRTCYKSEDKISEYSHNDFVGRMIKSNHTAMLEHGTVYLEKTFKRFEDNNYRRNPYSASIGGTEKTEDGIVWKWYITTNFRVLIENRWLEDFKYICEPTEYHEKRYTMKFICDRGVSHELVRHRVFSFAQESQRYCNYSKDKFDNHVTFIRPTWCTDIGILPGGIAAVRELDKTNWEFVHALCDAEQTYFDLLSNGWTPQQARSVLPNATKTEIVMTGFEDDWRHFFDLRLRGTTGKPHPDMQYLAQLAWSEFKDKLNLEL